MNKLSTIADGRLPRIVTAVMLSIILVASSLIVSIGNRQQSFADESEVLTQNATSIAQAEVSPLQLQNTTGFEVTALLPSGITDFNGDGFEDLAIGAPDDLVGGAVNVIYGSSSNGLSATSIPDQLWSQGSPGIEDSPEGTEDFGSSLATGDFNNDGYSDLAVGVQLEILGPIGAAGAVNVIYGSSTGLSATAVGGTGREDQFWHQNVANVEDVAESRDKFGASLAAGDFNGDDYSDLAIGVPAESIGAVMDAGAVNVIYGSSSGLSATSTPDQLWHQGIPGIEEFPETSEFFSAVAGTAYFDFFAFISSMTTGDFNNDGFDDLAVGVPNESVGAIGSAGAVNVIYGSASGLSPSTTIPNQVWHQNISSVEGTAGIDHFSYALA